MNKFEKIFDKFWNKYQNADFHGIDINYDLRHPLGKLFLKQEKEIQKLRQDLEDAQYDYASTFK